jgi:V/A-type H+-transporting ATPase subunit F
MAAKTGSANENKNAQSQNSSATKPQPGSGKKAYQSSKQIAVIGDEDTVIGFGLTGVKYLSTVSKDTDKKEIISIIAKYINSPELGFVIITQAIAERVRAEFERLKIEKSLYPIFIELPDKKGELPDREDPIKELIRRAIGMEIVKK